MRLVCPNCDAEYEVDDGLVPPEGRDVQCSNCTTTWFQAGAASQEEMPAPVAPELNVPSEPVAEPAPELSASPEPELEPEDAPTPEVDAPSEANEAPDPEVDSASEEAEDDSTLGDDASLAAIAASTVAAAGLTAKKPQVSPEAMDVIHEEVAFETAARKAETGGIETQPDLGLDDTDSEARASAARERMARRRGLEPQNSTIDDDHQALDAAPKREDSHEKSELFPDIEEINSSLSPETAEAEAEAARLEAKGGEAPPVKRSSGFRLGFGFMLLIFVALLLTYIYAPQIAQRAPSLAEPLNSYVTTVNGLRGSLDMAAEGLVEKIGTSLADQPEG